MEKKARPLPGHTLVKHTAVHTNGFFGYRKHGIRGWECHHIKSGMSSFMKQFGNGLRKEMQSA